MPDLAYLNLTGKVTRLDEACVPVLDRGFLLADSVYEVIAVYGKQPFRVVDHLERLRYSLRESRIPFVEFDLINRVSRELIRHSGYAFARLYLQITRGVAPRKHAFPEEASPTLLMMIDELVPVPTERLQRGARVVTADDPRWARCDIKSTALLPNVLFNQLAKENGAYETIFISQDGLVREGTHTNVFLVKGGTLVTPPLDRGVLPGVTRKVVFELAEELSISCCERPILREELYESDEVFLTGTTTEVLGIVQVDDRKIGAGEVGLITCKLEEAFRKLTGLPLSV